MLAFKKSVQWRDVPPWLFDRPKVITTYMGSPTGRNSWPSMMIRSRAHLSRYSSIPAFP
ncbi:hypothetical protein D3C81_2018290 [compost metagenome]